MKQNRRIRPTMRTSARLLSVLAFALIGAVCLPPPSSFAQGFGSRKMKMYLYPKQPPKVFPPNARFLVQMQPQAIVNQQNLRHMQEQLVKTLVSYNLRFNPVFAQPDIVITCVIPEVHAFPPNETPYTLEPPGGGDLSGDVDVKSPIGSTLQPYTLTVLEGHLTVRYSAKEAATGKTLDSDTMVLDFKQGYERNAPKINDLYDLLIGNLAHMIAARFVPDFNSIEILLPKARLKHASEQLQRGYWNSAIDELNSLPPFQKFDEESYRLYALAVAYEGLAYEPPYLNPTKEYLEKALAYYDDARRNNSAEATFQNSAARATYLLNKN